ncbi:MAG TPA: hypothetical protein VEK79_10160 [Thermoanaerobaculia bacterium]|nr:hypothetical protein [Thermoanaerobaculia bacterium]
MTTALTVHQPSALARNTDPPSPAQETAQRIVEQAAWGRLSPRHAGNLRRVFEDVEHVAQSIRRIADHGDRMAAGAAACARDIAECEAAVARYQAAAAASEAERAEAEERAKLAADVVQKEARVRGLTADVRAEELEIRLASLKAQRAPVPAAATREAAPRNSSAATPTDDDALLARLSREAASVLREVQAGVVLTDPRHPYHAFAGCLYLRARLDGDDAHAAAMRARAELIAHMREDHEFTPAERKAFRREYEDLKKRLDAKADTRQGATLLSMMQHVGAASAPGNGNGVQ